MHRRDLPVAAALGVVPAVIFLFLAQAGVSKVSSLDITGDALAISTVGHSLTTTSADIRAPAGTATVRPPYVPVPAMIIDSPRATIGSADRTGAFLDTYLRQHDSPLTGMGQVFSARGRQYDVDPRLLVAIAGNETGFGRKLSSRYDAFNWFYRGVLDSDFDSWQQAIDVVTKGIREGYLDEGRSTVALLGAKYGPVGAANDPHNLNVNFVPNVSTFLIGLGGNPEHLTFR